MTRCRRTIAITLLAWLSLSHVSGCGDDAQERDVPAGRRGLSSPIERIRSATAAVDDERLRRAETDPSNWLSHGRTYAEQRFSPLSQIHANNVGKLALAWRFPTSMRRGHEATPIVVDGLMVFTGSWSVVFPGFDLWLSHDDVAEIEAYIRYREAPLICKRAHETSFLASRRVTVLRGSRPGPP